LVIVQALPWGWKLAQGHDVRVTPKRLLGVVVVVLAYVVAGGTIAYVVGDAKSARHAIAYGLAWQGLIGGFLQGRVATDPPPSA